MSQSLAFGIGVVALLAMGDLAAPAHFAAHPQRTFTVALVVATPPGIESSAATMAQASALGPLLADAFARATRGLAAVEILPPRALAEPRPDDATQAPAEWARAYFASGGAPADAILALADGLPVAGASCGCSGWFLRAKSGLDAASPFDLTREWGDASGRLIGVGFFGTTLEDGATLEGRFLHEFGHAFCCRVAIPGLVDTSGSHWSRDVAFPGGSVMSGTGAGYDDFTLALMGVLPFEAARSARLADGSQVSGTSLVRALR